MHMLRGLADDGRTVIVVTHSVLRASTSATGCWSSPPGGQVAYYGPPQLAPAFFGRDDFQQVFQELTADTPEEWKARFLSSEPAARYMIEPLAGYVAGTRPEAQVEPLRQQKWLRQYWMLTRRYARVLAGDRANLVALLAVAPLLGLLQLGASPTDESRGWRRRRSDWCSQASLAPLVLAIGMTMMGMMRSAAEGRRGGDWRPSENERLACPRRPTRPRKS